MASTTTMGTAARAAIAEALMTPGGCRDNQLTIVHPHRRDTVAEIVALLADVEVVEWEGEEGTPYRSYRGRLPCGLRLDVITDREFVEPIDL